MQNKKLTLRDILSLKMNLQLFAEDGSGKGNPPAGDPGDKGNPDGKTSKDNAIKDKLNKHLNDRGNQGRGDNRNREPRYRNSISWHNKKKVLFDQSTKISLFKLAGSQTVGRAPGIGDLGQSLQITSNKIIAYEARITPGHVSTPKDAYNKAMIDEFNVVRGRYTNNIPFQANDLGTYNIAVGNILALVGQIKRSISYIGWNSVESALTPELLHAACNGAVGAGRDEATSSNIKQAYSKDVSELADNIFRLNAQIDRLGGLYIPKMSFFDFCNWIFRFAYFEDQTKARGDINLLYGRKFYQWKPDVPVVDAAATVASGCVTIDLSNYCPDTRVPTISDMLDMLEDMIDALVQDDSIRTISGWLFQNYKGALQDIATLSNTDTKEIPCDGAELDLMLRGAKIYHGDFPDIKQSVNNECLVASLTASTEDASCLSTHCINYSKSPTPDEIMISSIFLPMNVGGVMRTDVAVLTQVSLYAMVNHTMYAIAGDMFTLNLGDPLDVATELSRSISLASKPTTIVMTKTGSTIATVSFIHDVDFVVDVEADSIEKMHYASMVSLFTAERPSKE